MKILYDYQIYSRQNFGGISRYFYELSKGLKINGNKVINPVKFSDNIFTTDKEIFTTKHFLLNKGFKGKRSFQDIFNRKKTLEIIKSNKFDVFHPTYYNDYFLKVIKNDKPLVVTFYDLIHEKLHDKFPILTKENISSRKLLIDRANAIIAISNSTKKDLVEFYKIDPNKVSVVYLGNSLTPSIARTSNEDQSKYILFVGNRNFYKNFNFFITAIASTLKKEKELMVICAGGGNFTPEEINSFLVLGIGDKIIHRFINDTILAELYKNALFFVFPSLYEGFGIPVLEAFACSCPVVLSNRSSLPEVGGEAALYFDPENKEDIIDKVEKVLYDDKLRIKMKNKGIEQLQRFSWQETTKATIKIYNSLL